MCHCVHECRLLTGTWSPEGIMASGLVCRANRSNTWLHRPACKREEKLCQLGAVHTRALSGLNEMSAWLSAFGAKRTWGEAAACFGPDATDPKRA
jgi:hypothetical protein